MFQSKFSLACVSRISLAENCVAITRYNLSRFKETFDVFSELFMRSVQADVFDDLKRIKIL